MTDTERWTWFSTAASATLLAGSLVVLYKSAAGEFRSMESFPLVFALIVTLLLGIVAFRDRRPGWKLRTGLAFLTILVAVLAPVVQHRFLAAERLTNEALGMQALAGGTAPEIPYLEAIGWEATAGAPFVPAERVTLLNFWATWCNPCVAEMPRLEVFRQEHGGAGFELVGVTKLHGEGEAQLAAIREFLAELGVGYPILVADGESPGHTAYRVRSLPTSVLVDRSGRVVDYGIGIEGTDRLLARARELLNSAR